MSFGLFLITSIIIASFIIYHVKGLNCSTENSTIAKDDDHKENSKLASLIAQKAAVQAKEAYDTQARASIEASIKAKEELAERAKIAARIAQVALIGKQEIVDELEKNIKFTEGIIKEGTQKEQPLLQDGKSSMMGFSQQIEDLVKQLQILTRTVTQAETNEKNAASIAQEGASSKECRMKVSCHRIMELAEKLKTARNELENTMRTIRLNWHY